MALVNADYRFTYVDIGAYGRTSDGGVYNNCALSKALENSQLNIPSPSPIAGTNHISPYVIVADDAFALKPYLMKPYAMRNLTPTQRVFNYRLSRARRVVENAFGQLSQRFRVFGRPIPLAPIKVEKIVMASCCLHNYLLRDTQSQAVYMAHDECFSATSSQAVFTPLAHQVRDTLCQYFNSEGSLDGQERRSLEL